MQKDLKLIENPQLFYGCLHFRYNKKKYLYGISEQLLTFGEENGLLSKMNGTYQPSQRQKKEKSTLQLKKQKLIMKVDYVILPRKTCQSQYLWQFENLFQKLDCRQFLILTQNQHKCRSQNATEDYLLKRKLISLLKKENQQNLIQNTSTTFKVQMFRQHQNALKKGINQKAFQKPKQNHTSDIQNVFMEEVDEIFQQGINHLILQICKKQTLQYAQKSIFNHLKPSSIIGNISQLLNGIRHNQNNQKQLQLTPQQIQLKKHDLSEQILRISSSENVIYPTQNQQAQIIFLPMTSMIGILHKHNITLVNPSNLASWKLYHLQLPVSKVKQIILTRFSMSFVEFIIAWSSIGEQQKINTFLQIVTLDCIYEKIKQKLYELFLWDDEMICSKIAFRIIPSNMKNLPQQNSRQIKEKQKFYTLGNLKIFYQKDSIGQQSWVFKFGDKEILYFNEIKLWKQDLLKKFNFVIFDKIKQDIKNGLYERSKSNQQINKKCVYNRSSSSKYRNKYLYCLNQNNPIIRINSQIKTQQTFIPYILNETQKEKYHKVRLSPGQSINCLDRNIVVIQGLVAVTNEYFVRQNDQNEQNKYKKVQKQTYVWLCYPVDLIINDAFSSLSLNKIRKVRELISLKESLILVEELEDQHFFENHQIGIQNHSQGKQNSKNRGNFDSFLTQSNGQKSGNEKHKNRSLLSSPLITFDKLQICDMHSNSLIKLISKHSTNFHLSYKSLDQVNNHLPSSPIQSFSPLYQFSHLFKKVTLQSGQFINQNNQKVYFVIKGSLKWKNFQQNQITANNQSFIGNLKYFYQNKILSISSDKGKKQINTFSKDIEYQQKQTVPIQVIKDTWALQADLNELHQKFLIKFPQIAYWMVSKGKIFY